MRLRFALLIGALMLASLAGCGRSDDAQITVYRIPKELQPKQQPAAQEAPTAAQVQWTAPQVPPGTCGGRLDLGCMYNEAPPLEKPPAAIIAS